jgi:hypothetical protein
MLDTIYERLEEVLNEYVSGMTSRAVLNGALTRCRLTPRSLQAHDLSSLTEEVMVGLRMFCDPANLPNLMMALAELCDREVNDAAAVNTVAVRRWRPSQ